VVAGAVWVPGISRPIKSLFAGSRETIITFQVKKANLPVMVVERGNLESSENQDVFCKVEGPATTIISLLPEGSHVKKGDLVVELDASTLNDQLTNQEIATKSAEAAYQNAKLTREVAEIAVTEYIEGIYKQDSQTVQGEIALADSDRKRAIERLIWTEAMNKKGYVSDGTLTSEKLALQKANFTAEQALTKKSVLEKYTKGKTIKELKSEVEKTRSDELAKEQTWSLEKTKEAKLRTQISNCKLFAPGDGLVVYANDANKFGPNQQPQIEEGSSVRERQKVFSLPDITKMRVNTKVHESMIEKLHPGLRARIKVESFGDKTLLGQVTKVQPLPDVAGMFASDVKVYTTHVAIEDSFPGLRPGMSAQVEILVKELKDVLSVPLQAVLQFKEKDHIAVKSPTTGRFDWREVTLGTSNDKLVEVTKGIAEGELVALNPIALMTEEEKREAFGSSGKDASKKEWGTTKVGDAAGGAGKGAPDGKGKAEGKGGDPSAKGKRKGGGGGMNPAFMQKFQSISPEDRARMREATPEERNEILKKAGFSDAELEQMQQMRQGGGGGFGGGRPGGGMGGPGGQP
jgi:HlyD family secretion protein